MAYVLRSLAVIGVIALNSPVHGDRTPAAPAAEAASTAARLAGAFDSGIAPNVKAALGAASAAREAAEVLAGLDPQTRQRLFELAATATAAPSSATRPEPPARR